MLDLEIIGEGATAKIYRDGDTAIKLYENAPPNEAENEAERQRFAYDAGLPVPAVYGVRHLNGGATALDMAYIDGKPLMWLDMDEAAAKNAIQTLVRLQRIVHHVRAAGFPKQADRLAGKIAHTQHLDEAAKSRMRAELSRLDDGADNLCHGDFHPLNILQGGERHWIIDWVDATAGSPLADACRTYLIFKQHMARSAGIYLRAFCREAGAQPADVLTWMPVIAAGRLDENMDDRARAQLLEFIVGGETENGG